MCQFGDDLLPAATLNLIFYKEMDSYEIHGDLLMCMDSLKLKK